MTTLTGVHFVTRAARWFRHRFARRRLSYYSDAPGVTLGKYWESNERWAARRRMEQHWENIRRERDQTEAPAEMEVHDVVHSR
jgi:hypothetical protein